MGRGVGSGVERGVERGVGWERGEGGGGGTRRNAYGRTQRLEVTEGRVVFYAGLAARRKDKPIR